MDSMSRAMHRRKLSSKNAYDGVFSGHRSKYEGGGGSTVVNVEEYREIFGGGGGSSIPVLDLSGLNNEANNNEFNNMEMMKKGDYGSIFGGFRDFDLAVTYDEMLARDIKHRAPSSTSQSSQDMDDLSHQSSDALKQFNLSYNKISQRSMDGLDGTTHVTQLHEVPGFTCFIDESASQPKKETKKQKSSVSSKRDFPDKQTSLNDVESKSKHHKKESSSDDTKFKTFQSDFESPPNKVSSPPAAATTNNEAASKPKKETKKQIFLSDDSTFTIFQADIPSKVSSPPAASTTNHEAASQPKKEPEKQKSLSDDLSFQSFQEDIRSEPSKVSSPPAASTSNNEAASQPEKQTEKKKTLPDDINHKTFQIDSRSQFSNAPTASTINHEAVPQTKKETEKQKSLSDTFQVNIGSQPSNAPTASTINHEAVSQTKKETEKQKSLSDTFQADIGSQPSKVSSTPAASSTNYVAASQPKKETKMQKSLSDDINSNTCQADIKSHPSKVSSPPPASATNDEPPSLPKKKTKKQKSLSDDTFTFQANFGSAPLKVSSPPAAFATKDEPPSQPKKESKKQKSLSGEINFTAFQVDIKSHPSKASSSHETSATNLDNHKEYQMRSNASNTETTETDAPKEIPPTWFDEELDVNSAAATSAAALRKAIEKAEESIRIAKESVGRKKDGLKYSSKSFKDSLKVKRRVANVSAGEEQQEKDDIIKVRNHHKHVADGEKLFGAKKVINNIYGKIAESAKNMEIPIWSRFESRDNKRVFNSEEVVAETKAESIQDSTHEAPKKDIQRPNDFLVESCEKEAGDAEDKIDNDKDEVGPSNVDQLVEELNNLTVYQNVEEEKKTTEGSDQSVFEKRLSEEASGLLETEKQEVPMQEHDEKVLSEEVLEDEMELKEYSDTERHKEEDTGDKFYDVREVEMIVNAETKEDCEMKDKENDSLEETWKKLERFYEPEVYENSSSDYDSAVDSESVHGVSRIVIDTEDACKVDQNNSSESSQVVDDVSAKSEFQVVDKEVKEIFENIFADQTASEDNEDECEAKSDDLSNGGLAEVDFEQNAPEQIDIMSESSSDTIHGMELEVKEYAEKEETVEEETVVSVKEEDRPEIEIKMETGTSQEHTVEKEETKRIKEVTPEDRERERNRLAVERAIREARERAFAEARERVERAAVERANAEVRQRVLADAQEKIAKASSDKTSAQSKLRAERAAVERATAEARKRALEKAMSQKKISEPRIQVTEIRQTSSSDLHISDGTSTESALRSKAKLEKHNRIMERAAKALAEKEKRDLLVLREQAERSRLSENLDAEIKRWSTGKEGNLRALLSTLQYILGADSGWQSVSLTDIITTTAVKKAYRKATLCVHPDKLQQRGASIQQKYICEKVFDLLKAAWNRFNSEER
ncbi:hypothetical protein CTI12_AA206230 [Artemisia annua]|uniref:J domain-containing protein n=1 Tax=Artemisia annua TaxID=35608 RepID=A0A2U1P113_ARTAN|nr:hypothetical protein CTI12_AA206230 [Artemisia annua]